MQSKSDGTFTNARNLETLLHRTFFGYSRNDSAN